MQPEIKNRSARKAKWIANRGHSWFEAPMYYVSIAYRGRQLGLIVATDSEEVAQREGEALCMDLGHLAKPISVTKVVIQ
jgi:hypothetical protein